MIKEGTEVRVRNNVDAFAGCYGTILDHEKSKGYQCRVKLHLKPEIPVFFMFSELEEVDEAI